MAGREEAEGAGGAAGALHAAPHQGLHHQGPAAQEDRQHRLLPAGTPADARLQVGDPHKSHPCPPVAWKAEVSPIFAASRHEGFTSLGCLFRRVLNSPDFQLLVRAREKCECGSGLFRADCCHQEVRPEEGRPVAAFPPVHLRQRVPRVHQPQGELLHCLGPCIL